jgi:hypothetical protein
LHRPQSITFAFRGAVTKEGTREVRAVIIVPSPTASAGAIGTRHTPSLGAAGVVDLFEPRLFEIEHGLGAGENP